MNPGTWRNAERTGERKVTRLSTVARTIPRVRHVDIDLVQYCPKCKKPQVFAEVKSHVIPDSQWDQMRRHADAYGHKCIALLVVEVPDSELLGVRVYTSEDKKLTEVVWGDEEHLGRVLARARDIHECWKQGQLRD